MIIGDLNITGIPGAPSETNSPLIIDADTVLSLSIAAQSFQAMRRRQFEVAQSCGGVYSIQPHFGLSLYLRRQFSGKAAAADLAGLLIQKILYYGGILTEGFSSVKRQYSTMTTKARTNVSD